MPVISDIFHKVLDGFLPSSTFAATRKIPIFIKLIILFIILLLPCLPLFSRLVMEDGKTGRIVKVFPLQYGDRFEMVYTHSVNRTVVVDEFEIDDEGALILKATTSQSFGAGIQEAPEPGEVFLSTSKGLFLANINRRLSEYRLFVGTVAGHTFKSKYITASLDEWVPKGSPVIFKVKYVSFISILWRSTK